MNKRLKKKYKPFYKYTPIPKKRDDSFHSYSYNYIIRLITRGSVPNMESYFNAWSSSINRKRFNEYVIKNRMAKRIHRKRNKLIRRNNSKDVYLYHLSRDPDLKYMSPRCPENIMFMEDEYSARISFSTTLEGAIQGSPSADPEDLETSGNKFYLYENICDNKLIKFPNFIEVPDVELSNEVWVLEDVSVRKVAELTIFRDSSRRLLKIPYSKLLATKSERYIEVGYPSWYAFIKTYVYIDEYKYLDINNTFQQEGD